MKQNWWKILVVMILAAAVGIVLAGKDKAPAPKTDAKTETRVTTTAEPDAVKTDADAKEVEDVVEPQAATLVEKPVNKQPIKQAVVKKDEPKDDKDKPKEKPVKATAKKLPKLLELGADKCVPCKLMKPIIDEISNEYKGKLDVEYIDVWKTEGVSEKYGIESIPAQIFFDENGKEFFRHQGYFPKEDILKTFEEHGIKL